MKPSALPRSSKRLTRRKAMRRESARHAAERRRRAPIVAQIRRERGNRCQFPRGCRRTGTDPHELLPRSGQGSITNKANIVLLCWQHHRWAHHHPREAIELGLKVSRYSPPAAALEVA